MATVVITGANRGIGFELAKQYQYRGDRVVALCRHVSPELKKLDVEIQEGVDVNSDDSLKRTAEQLKGTEVDILFNNAGIMKRDGSLADLDFSSLEQQFEVNAVGPLRVTKHFLSCLKKGSKVALMTSRMGSIEDNDSGGNYGYRMSKAALNMAGKTLALELRDRDIAVALLHPGFVRTEMTGYNGNLEPHEAAEGLINRMDELTLKDTGCFWHSQGEVLPW